MTTESDIRELYSHSTMDDSEFKEKIIGILYELMGRIRDLEDDIARLK